jgi:hypothetical protein
VPRNASLRSDCFVSVGYSCVRTGVSLDDSHSASILRILPVASSGDYITSYTNGKYWQHEYRNYHVSITLAGGDPVEYAIGCKPNLDHASCAYPACPKSVVYDSEIVI